MFPVGMYAACSFIVGSATDVAPITDFGRLWVWVAVAVWAVTFAAMVEPVVQVGRGKHPPFDERRLAELAPGRER